MNEIRKFIVPSNPVGKYYRKDEVDARIAAGGGGGTWGSITGTLSDQTDLQDALDDKADLSGDTFTGTIKVKDNAAATDLSIAGTSSTNSGVNISNTGTFYVLHEGTEKIISGSTNTEVTNKLFTTGGVLLSSNTASQLLATDGSKNLVSLSTATYPSLAELAHVKGVTSAIQTQLNTIPDNLTDFTGQTAWRVFYSNADGDVTELALGADGTFLKSNGASSAPSFATPAGSGDVTKVGTPVDNQVGVWTGDGTLEGDAALTFDTSTNTLATEIVTVTDDAYGAGWNGSTAVPTKNALYDKIETLSAGGISEELAIAYAVAL